MKAPSQAVIVAGAAAGAFGRFPDLDHGALARPCLDQVLQQTRLDPHRIECVFVGNGFGGIVQGQEAILAQTLLRDTALAGAPMHTVKNACSSGADAVHLAWAAVAFGQYDCVLALGVEKMSHAERGRTIAALATASDRLPESPDRSVFMDLNAERAQRYMRLYGATPRHFALCAAKNRAHAALNPRAAQRTPISVEEILADKTVIAPLTRSMCGGIADGAAAVLLVSDAFARRHGLAGPRIAASAIVSGLPAGAESATRRAGLAAYAQAGIGPDEVDLAEVHDPTAPQEMLDIEDLDLAPRGGAVALVEQGATSLGGARPVNLSGGLVSRGHPVGATGVAQVVELTEQLTGRAGALQAPRARVGLAQMAGGLLGADSAVAAVHLLVAA